MLTTPILLWTFLMTIVVLTIVHWIHKRNEIRKMIDKIPGPPTLPIIGNLKDVLCPPVKLWSNMRRLAKEYPSIYRIWCGHVPTVMLFSPEDVEILISSTKNMEKSRIYDCLHGWLGTGLLTSAGNKWQSRRKLLTPAFHFNILQQFMGVFAEQSDLLIEQLKGECNMPYTDIVPYITKFTLHSICETAMGTQFHSFTGKEEEYQRAIYKMGDLLIYRIVRPWLHYDGFFFLTKAFREQRKLAKLLHAFSINVIRNRTNSSQTEDMQKGSEEANSVTIKIRLAMLDLLISAKKSGESIDEEGIREEVDTFMFEGHDTTTMSICFTLMLLACHQDIQEKVVTELNEVLGDSNEHPSYHKLQQLKYLDMVLKESLRIYPSVPFISRITSEEVHIHSGYTIPAGIIVNVPIYDIHNNPKLYPEPHKFNPDRFLPENTQKRHPFAYIPFSAGPRNCIGQKFAILELKTVIAKILKNFKLLAFDKPDSITLMADIILRTNHGIRVKFQPRNKSYIDT